MRFAGRIEPGSGAGAPATGHLAATDALSRAHGSSFGAAAAGVAAVVLDDDDDDRFRLATCFGAEFLLVADVERLATGRATAAESWLVCVACAESACGAAAAAPTASVESATRVRPTRAAMRERSAAVLGTTVINGAAWGDRMDAWDEHGSAACPRTIEEAPRYTSGQI